MLLVGITHEDTEQDAKYLADKVAGLRIFEDEARENESFRYSRLEEQILSVSQFTLVWRLPKREDGPISCLPQDLNKRSRYMNNLMSCFRSHGLTRGNWCIR